MADNQEIVATFGADTAPFDRAIRSMKQNIGEASESGHRGFVHIGSAGRSFHHLIEEITKSSPVMGSALKFAISPIIGVLGAAGAAFAYFHEKIKETNKELDRIGDEAAKPIGDIAKAIHDGKKKLEEFNREFEKWLQSQHPSDTITKHLSTQLDLLKLQTAELHKLTGQDMERVELQTKLKLQMEARKQLEKDKGIADEDVSHWANTIRKYAVDPSIASAEANKGEAEKHIEEARAKIDKLEKEGEGFHFSNAIRAAIASGETGLETLLPGLPSESHELVEEIVRTKEQLEYYKKSLAKSQKTLDREENNQRERMDLLHQSQHIAGSINTDLGKVKEEEGATRRILGVMGPENVAPLGGTASTRATAKWVAEHQTKLDKWNSDHAKAADAFAQRPQMGNPIDTAKPESGDEALKRMADRITDLHKLASGPGIHILPQMGQ